MSVAVISGSADLIGSEASVFFAGMGLDIVGIDNDMRKTFFSQEASTVWNRERLQQRLGKKHVEGPQGSVRTKLPQLQAGEGSWLGAADLFGGWARANLSVD